MNANASKILERCYKLLKSNWCNHLKSTSQLFYAFKIVYSYCLLLLIYYKFSNFQCNVCQTCFRYCWWYIIIKNYIHLIKKRTRLFNKVNCDFLQCIQTEASPSGTQTAACSETAFLPPRKDWFHGSMLSVSKTDTSDIE